MNVLGAVQILELLRGVRVSSAEVGALLEMPALARILASVYDAMLDDAQWPATSALINEACGLWADGRLTSASILSRFGRECRVRIAGADDVRTITTERGETYSIVAGVGPVFQSAAVEGTTLTLIYNEALDGSSTPGTSNFTVEVGGSGRSVTRVAVSGIVVALTLDPAVKRGKTGITVSYTVPTGTGATPIQDVVGNDAGALTDQEVENKTASADTSAPLFLSAGMSSDGSTITLTFDEPLDGGNGPTPGDFAVMVEAAPRAVSTAAVVGRSVELSLASPVIEGQTVRVNYTDPTAGVDDSNAIQDTDGNDAASLTAQVPSRAAWSALMTVGANEGYLGYGEVAGQSIGSITDEDFNWQGTDYTVTAILYNSATRSVSIELSTALVETDRLMLHLGTLGLDFADAQGNHRQFSWEEMDLGWVDGEEVAVHLAEVFALSMPANVEMVAGDGSLSVSWSVVTDADGYKVQWKSGSEQYDGSRERTVQTNQASIGGLEDGTPYTIRVRGTNAGGVGKWSDEVTGTPRRADGPRSPGGGGGGGGGGGVRQTVPDAPSNLLADGTDGAVTLAWDAPEDDGGSAVTDYEYRIDRRNPWTSIGSTDTTHTVTGLVNGTAYVFEVRAVNRIGKSFSSRRAEATPEAPEVFTLDFAHFANGTGITSDLVLVNVDPQPIRPAIYFYDTEGALVSAESVVDVTGDLEVTEDGALTVQMEMEPLGELTISTHGQGELVSGSVKVVSDGPIGGGLRYNLPAIGEAVVGASPPVGDALFPVRRQEGGINTGVAIHNLGEEAMEARCELMREGVLRDFVSISLEANGQTSWMIDQAFPAADTVRLHGVGALRRSRQGDGSPPSPWRSMPPGASSFRWCRWTGR